MLVGKPNPVTGIDVGKLVLIYIKRKFGQEKLSYIFEKYFSQPIKPLSLMSNALPYARYNTIEDAESLITLLKENNIPYELLHEVNQLDNIYLGETLDQLYVLNLPKEQFPLVNQLLQKQAAEDFAKPDFTHYFDSFDENDLLEVLQYPNEWNAYDAAIARLMLEKRQVAHPAVTDSIAYTQSYKPERIKTQWLIMCYILSFSIAGIFIGLMISKSKKTLQNGASVYMYDEYSRQRGTIMILLGALGSSLYLSSLFLRR